MKLRTDLRPGIEFASVHTNVRPVGLGEVAPASPDQDFGSGVTVAERNDLRTGDYTVEVTLQRADGVTVTSRRVRLHLANDRLLVVTISSDCVGVECPGPGDAEEATECLAGRCVPPRCVDPSEPGCGGAECGSGPGCAETPACADAACVDGICLALPYDDRCASGEYCSASDGCRTRPGAPMDGGTPDASRDASRDAASDAGEPDADAGGEDAGPPERCVGDGGLTTCTCPEDATCTLGCPTAGASTCEATCKTGSDCTVECGSGTCDVQCELGTDTCHVECAEGASCSLSCEMGGSCGATPCNDPSGCLVRCEASICYS